MLSAQKRFDVVAHYAAALSLLELALGSLLHAFHVPFSGTFLSLNQGYLLCRATLAAAREGGGRTEAYVISNVAAVLKSLAPAGKKLGPMLSLSAQGGLFGLGVIGLGPNLPGLVVGMVLLSLWTFVQPVLTYFLFFGSHWLTALEFLFRKTMPWHGLSLSHLAWVFAAVVGAKAVAAGGLAVAAWRGGGEWQDRLLRLAESKGPRAPMPAQGPTAWLALRDLTQPLFLISLVATAVFLYFTEGPAAEKIWLMLRPLAIGFLFFYFSRKLFLEGWLAKLKGTRFEHFALACDRAWAEVKKRSAR